MTQKEINATITEYWKEMYQNEELQSLDYSIKRIIESRKIGNYLLVSKEIEVENYFRREYQ